MYTCIYVYNWLCYLQLLGGVHLQWTAPPPDGSEPVYYLCSESLHFYVHCRVGIFGMQNFSFVIFTLIHLHCLIIASKELKRCHNSHSKRREYGIWTLYCPELVKVHMFWCWLCHVVACWQLTTITCPKSQLLALALPSHFWQHT